MWCPIHFITGVRILRFYTRDRSPARHKAIATLLFDELVAGVAFENEVADPSEVRSKTKARRPDPGFTLLRHAFFK